MPDYCFPLLRSSFSGIGKIYLVVNACIGKSARISSTFIVSPSSGLNTTISLAALSYITYIFNTLRITLSAAIHVHIVSKTNMDFHSIATGNWQAKAAMLYSGKSLRKSSRCITGRRESSGRWKRCRQDALNGLLRANRKSRKGFSMGDGQDLP